MFVSCFSEWILVKFVEAMMNFRTLMSFWLEICFGRVIGFGRMVFSCSDVCDDFRF